jgi:hypothetical protein
MDQPILHILNDLTPIALEEMDKVKLMDRMDSKYMFTLQTLPGVIEACKPYYFVSNINNQRYSSYETIYYDTENFSLYNQHHAGKLNRYKVRKRTYVESKLSFLEVKFKDNKGRTTKTRIKLKTNAIDERAREFLEKETPLKIADLKPSVKIDYNRITLVHKDLTERITIDVNLSVSRDAFTRTFNNLVIAEVKQNRSTRSEFTHFMRELRVKEGSMSKYCIGVSSLVEQVKKNNFKEKNRNINKLNKV